jgi:hypothetical protein
MDVYLNQIKPVFTFTLCAFNTQLFNIFAESLSGLLSSGFVNRISKTYVISFMSVHLRANIEIILITYEEWRLLGCYAV